MPERAQGEPPGGSLGDPLIARALVPDSGPFDSFRAWIEETCSDLGLSLQALSLACGLGHATLWGLAYGDKSAGDRVRRALRETLGISLDELARLLPPHTPTARNVPNGIALCDECGREYRPTRSDQRFHSPECKREAERKRYTATPRTYTCDRCKGSKRNPGDGLCVTCYKLERREQAERNAEERRKRAQEGHRERGRKLAASWAPFLNWEHDMDTPFSRALRRQLLKLELTREKAAALAGVSPKDLSNYIGVGVRAPQPLPRPPLHKLGCLARLWTGTDASPTQIERQIQHLWSMLKTDKRTLSPVGLLLLRNAAELNKPLGAFRLRPETRDRLLWQGFASPRVCKRLGRVLPAREYRELLRRLRPWSARPPQKENLNTRLRLQTWREKIRPAYVEIIQELKDQEPTPRALRTRSGCNALSIDAWLSNPEERAWREAQQEVVRRGLVIMVK